MIDLVYVTYNSEKWIENCIKSIVKSDYDKKEIHIVIVDNASIDKTRSILEEMKRRYENLFGEIEIVQNVKNEGFGRANNIGFKRCVSDIVCFINIDTELAEDAFKQLEQEIADSDEKTALWEFRQYPFEHPKIYDPLTGETGWASGAAFAVRRKVFEEVNGFDERIFLYVEDVDLSWRIRWAGYRLKYVPNVKIIHYSYENGVTLKMDQYVYGVINNILLRYRYGTFRDICWGHLIFFREILHQEVMAGAKKKLVLEYIRHYKKIFHFFQHGKYKKNRGEFFPSFIHTDYSINRQGAFYKSSMFDSSSDFDKKPLVSILVRTCQRPDVLRESLLSIQKQTYKNLEVIVVEDGENCAEEMIRTEFSKLKIHYLATGTKVGRSKAGNIAMQKASGKYLNFLDDDDLFFADHVEVLAAALEHSEKKAAYAIGLETSIVVESKKPYQYQIKTSRTAYQQGFDRVMLCHHNYIPIQCMMFQKELFLSYGGLDESVDALEDWDLWVRYSMYTDFIFVEKTTSVYRVPYEKSISQIRQKQLDDALAGMREKHKSYKQLIDVKTIAELYEKTIM